MEAATAFQAMLVTDGINVLAWNSAMEVSNSWKAGKDDNVSSANNSIHPYPSQYSWTHIILSSSVISVLMLVIVFGNILVIVAIARDRHLSGHQNWFMASLAVSDILVGMFIMPLSLSNELMGYWAFGDVLCELWLATDVLLCTASILNLVLISLDRYWSVTRAITYVKHRTPRLVITLIAVVWILSMCVCLPPLAGWKRPQPEKSGFPLCNLSEEPGYVVYSTVMSFYIPLTVMVLVYLKIFLLTRRRARRSLRKPLKKDCDFQQSGEALHNQRKSNIEMNPYARKNKSSCCSNRKPDKEVFKFNLEVDDDDNCNVETSSNAKYRQLISWCNSDSGCQTQTPPILGDANEYLKVREMENGYQEKMAPQSYDEEQVRKSNDTVAHQDSVELVITSKDITRKKSILEMVTKEEIEQEIENVQTRMKTTKFLAISNLTIMGHTLFSTENIRTKQSNDRLKALRDPETIKRRIARAKERRAILVLGVVMASFVGCWLPFFSVYLVTSLVGLTISPTVFAVIFWLGYCNSALNPFIYTIFNRDFRKAFKRIICGKSRVKI